MKMEYKWKDVLSNGKPSYMTDVEWEYYIKSGERKHFKRFNHDKSIIVGSLLGVASSLFVLGLWDLITHPRLMTMIDVRSITIATIIYIVAIVIVKVFDRMEELHRLQSKDCTRQIQEMMEKVCEEHDKKQD